MLPLNDTKLKEINRTLDDIKNRENDVLRQIFGKKIKQSFLIEMKEKIVESYEFINLIAYVYNISDFDKNMVLGYDNWNYDVCKYITMIHFNNTLLLTDDERGSLQKDYSYKDKLFNQVIEAIKLKKYGACGVQHDSIESYFPITYAANACACYLIGIFNDMIQRKKNLKVKNSNFQFATLYKILVKIKASLVLIDNCLFEEAYNPLRSAIELFMIYLTAGQSGKDVIDTYTTFVECKSYYQINRQIPEVITKLFNKHNLSNKVTIIDYLNYGWLDSIIEYGYINKSERLYRLKDVAELINMEYQNQIKYFGDILYDMYRSCNQMSHGFIGGINAFNSKIELSQKCVFVLGQISSIIRPMIDSEYDFIFNDVDILEYMDKTSNDIEKIMKNISSDKLEKLNEDYKMIVK